MIILRRTGLPGQRLRVPGTAKRTVEVTRTLADRGLKLAAHPRSSKTCFSWQTAAHWQGDVTIPKGGVPSCSVCVCSWGDAGQACAHLGLLNSGHELADAGAVGAVLQPHAQLWQRVIAHPAGPAP